MSDMTGCEVKGHDTGDVLSACDFIRVIAKTVRTARIYRCDHTVLIKFYEEAHAKLVGHLEKNGALAVEVEQFELKYRGEVVYRNRNPQDSLAFAFRADGIRSLAFLPGVEQREVASFLATVGAQLPSRDHDDLATRLWGLGLSHIQWRLEEDLQPASNETPPRGSQQEQIQALLASLEGCYLAPPLILPKHLLMLTGEEAEWLRRSRHSEAERDPIADVLDIVTAVLAGVAEPSLFEEFAAISGKLAADLLAAGEMRHALRLVRFLAQLRRSGTIAAAQREKLTQALSAVLSESVVPLLQQELDERETVTPAELKELLSALGASSIPAICRLLGLVRKLSMRKVIVQVLVELGRHDPAVFAEFLEDPRWYLVRNIVVILSMVEGPVALDLIVRLASHPEARVRKEVLRFLIRSRDPKAKPYILKFLRDGSSTFRIQALEALVRERHPAALKAALAMAMADDFNAKAMGEKKVICEAIGALGSEGVLSLFEEMLQTRHWFKKTLQKERVACAVAGLAKMNSSAALQLLQQARREKNQEIKGIIEDAMAGMVAA